MCKYGIISPCFVSKYFVFLFCLRTWKSKKGEVGRAVRLALQYGYRHIDCAHIYLNEDEIGETFTEVFKEGKVKREDVFVTSKLWWLQCIYCSNIPPWKCIIYRLTYSSSELSEFTCMSSPTMNKKIQYRTRPPSAVLDIWRRNLSELLVLKQNCYDHTFLYLSSSHECFFFQADSITQPLKCIQK